MCNGSSTPKAHAFFKQKSQILRQNSDVSVPSVDTVADSTTVKPNSGSMAGRPWSALQQGTRPLSAQKNMRRPISAPRLQSANAAANEKLARFQEAWVARHGASVQKKKKPRDPFKDFLADDPRMSQLIVERTLEDSHLRSCKFDLHHKAVLGKLDAASSGLENHSSLPQLGQGVLAKSERVLAPVQGLHELQQHMMQSHRGLCESNPEAMGSFIAKVEERKQRRSKENRENKKRDDLKRTQSSGTLNEFKTMLHAVQNPKAKTLELWNTSQAVGFRNRFRKVHDQHILEKLDVAQAVQIYREGHKTGKVQFDF